MQSRKERNSSEGPGLGAFGQSTLRPDAPHAPAVVDVALDVGWPRRYRIAEDQWMRCQNCDAACRTRHRQTKMTWACGAVDQLRQTVTGHDDAGPTAHSPPAQPLRRRVHRNVEVTGRRVGLLTLIRKGGQRREKHSAKGRLLPKGGGKPSHVTAKPCMVIAPWPPKAAHAYPLRTTRLADTRYTCLRLIPERRLPAPALLLLRVPVLPLPVLPLALAAAPLRRDDAVLAFASC